jgi:hypothetical protein
VTALLGEAPGAGMQPTSPQPSLTTMSDAQTARAIQILTTDSVARPGPAVRVWRGNSSLTSIFPPRCIRAEPDREPFVASWPNVTGWHGRKVDTGGEFDSGVGLLP